MTVACPRRAAEQIHVEVGRHFVLRSHLQQPTFYFSYILLLFNDSLSTSLAIAYYKPSVTLVHQGISEYLDKLYYSAIPLNYYSFLLSPQTNGRNFAHKSDE